MAVKSTRVAWARPRWAALAVAAVACLRCGGSSKDNSDANGGKPSASGGVSAGGNAGAAGSSLAEGAKSGSAASGSGGAGGANVGGANSATGGRLGSSGSGGSAGVAGQPAAGGAAGHAGTNGANGGAGASSGAGASGAGASGSSAGGNASAGSEGKGGSAGSAGTGGMSGLEYRACEPGGSVTRITVYRIDAAAQTCTEVVVQQGAGGCTLGLISGGYCLSRASVSKDVTACQMLMPATGGVDATSVTGTFSVSSGASFVVGLDVTFQFPSSAGLPTTVQTQITGCAADCLLNDCRT